MWVGFFVTAMCRGGVGSTPLDVKEEELVELERMVRRRVIIRYGGMREISWDFLRHYMWSSPSLSSRCIPPPLPLFLLPLRGSALRQKSFRFVVFEILG